MIATVAHAGHLLVACDFDGTLAPIVDDPDQAAALPRSLAALARLAGRTDTTVAIVSGRRRTDLLGRFDADVFILVGEHGADAGTDPPGDSASLRAARRLVDSVVGSTEGSRAEHKLRSVAFHYRTAPDPVPGLDRLRREAAQLDDLTVIEGKRVFELTAADDTKGSAVEHMRQRTGADAVLFVGDDTTDEAVFAMLGPTDLGVKVGAGPTLAPRRVTGPEAVADLLEQLVDVREAR